uniref:Uncharacterized protein n=1 Tax=Hyaloperonospora arabidopsidis (strain Emoy2) TaxID=559515 RepID=M4B215_HYAAE
MGRIDLVILAPQQPLPQADAAIATTPKCDTTTTTSPAEVAMTKKYFAYSGTSLPPATIDDKFVHIRSVPRVSTTDVAVLSKPSHAALYGGCVRGKHALEEPTRSEAIGTSLDTTETSSAVVVNNSSRQLATQSVSSPSEWSQTTVRHKRQLPHDLGSAVSVTSFHPPSKRSAVERKVAAAAVQETRPDRVQPSADQEAAVVDHVSNYGAPNPADTAVNIQTPDVLVKIGVVAEDESHLPVEEGSPTCQAAAGKLGDLESGNSCRLSAPSTQQLVDTMPLRPPERSLVQIQTISSSSSRTPANGLRPSAMTKGGVSVTALSTGGESSFTSAATAVESSAKATNVGVIIDSPVNVQKTMRTGLEKSRVGNACPTQAVQPTVSSASRPLNAWGASFGMVAPAYDVLSMSRTPSTTPLSSWFLSKGSANFVKQVHFSDDDADDDSSSSGEDVSLVGELLISNAVEKVSFKRRALITKKNAFLGSLLTQSHWRSWYGSVDPQNLLDPPLTHVPEKLRNHEITFLSVPKETIENDNSVSAKTTNELESLEASIRFVHC